MACFKTFFRAGRVAKFLVFLGIFHGISFMGGWKNAWGIQDAQRILEVNRSGYSASNQTGPWVEWLRSNLDLDAIQNPKQFVRIQIRFASDLKPDEVQEFLGDFYSVAINPTIRGFHSREFSFYIPPESSFLKEVIIPFVRSETLYLLNTLWPHEYRLIPIISVFMGDPSEGANENVIWDVIESLEDYTNSDRLAAALHTWLNPDSLPAICIQRRLNQVKKMKWRFDLQEINQAFFDSIDHLTASGFHTWNLWKNFRNLDEINTSNGITYPAADDRVRGSLLRFVSSRLFQADSAAWIDLFAARLRASRSILLPYIFDPDEGIQLAATLLLLSMGEKSPLLQAIPFLLGRPHSPHRTTALIAIKVSHLHWREIKSTSDIEFLFDLPDSAWQYLKWPTLPDPRLEPDDSDHAPIFRNVIGSLFRSDRINRNGRKSIVSFLSKAVSFEYFDSTFVQDLVHTSIQENLLTPPEIWGFISHAIGNREISEIGSLIDLLIAQFPQGVAQRFDSKDWKKLLETMAPIASAESREKIFYHFYPFNIENQYLAILGTWYLSYCDSEKRKAILHLIVEALKGVRQFGLIRNELLLRNEVYPDGARALVSPQKMKNAISRSLSTLNQEDQVLYWFALLLGQKCYFPYVLDASARIQVEDEAWSIILKSNGDSDLILHLAESALMNFVDVDEAFLKESIHSDKEKRISVAESILAERAGRLGFFRQRWIPYSPSLDRILREASSSSNEKIQRIGVLALKGVIATPNILSSLNDLADLFKDSTYPNVRGLAEDAKNYGPGFGLRDDYSRICLNSPYRLFQEKIRTLTTVEEEKKTTIFRELAGQVFGSFLQPNHLETLKNQTAGNRELRSFFKDILLQASRNHKTYVLSVYLEDTSAWKLMMTESFQLYPDEWSQVLKNIWSSNQSLSNESRFDLLCLIEKGMFENSGSVLKNEKDLIEIALQSAESSDGLEKSTARRILSRLGRKALLPIISKMTSNLDNPEALILWGDLIYAMPQYLSTSQESSDLPRLKDDIQEILKNETLPQPVKEELNAILQEWDDSSQ